MRAKFAEQWKEDFLEESFASTGELQCGASRECWTRSVRSLQPQKIEKRKTNLQTGPRGKVESGSDVREEKVVGSRGNSVFVADAAAAVAQKKPANDGDSGGADAGEVGGNNVTRMRRRQAGITPRGTPEVATVVEPGVIHCEKERGGSHDFGGAQSVLEMIRRNDSTYL